MIIVVILMLIMSCKIYDGSFINLKLFFDEPIPS